MTDSASLQPGASRPHPLPSHAGLLLSVVVAVTVLTEWIGPIAVPLGPARIVLLPMLLALVITTVLAVLRRRLPAALQLGTAEQAWAGRLLNAALLLFIVKLGLMAGGSMPQLRQVGWALAFQELGHAFGTMALALPLALLLGIKREAVGATFSIGRENSLVIIGQKYGLQSAEGRGVLAEYITGTVLGAVFITLLASFVVSLDIFDLRSLAMGAGVGSGSLMAAALGVITVGQSPEAIRELTAIAAAANLIAGVAGFYFAVFVTLPLCNWLYARLEPVLGRTALARRAPSTSDLDTGVVAPEDENPGPLDSVLALLLMLVGVCLSNRIGHGVGLAETLPGVAVMIAIVLLGMGLKLLLRRLPLMLFLAVAATLVTIPGGWPLAEALGQVVGKVQFMSITTTVLALAGFSVASRLPMFRRLGWRIVLVSLTASAGTFIGAAAVAEFFH